MKFSLALLVSATGALAAPTPPGIPTESTARSLLSGLTVGTPTNTDTYDRDLFPHWETVSGACNTREFVLQRDGTNVVTNSACAATSGTWRSPYDGATWTAASDVDIDHMVPLQNAWISGAASWTTAKRRDFANDITRPQLWAVTDNVNQAKGSATPATWKPPLTSFYCTYAKSWIQVKSYWQLAITSAEKTALTDMLNYC
ncbi:bacterial-type extracellular deoxyribonuclease [Fusarium vanettenii 77-13-4]|uniref:Bacterial-type extracellular deoxyribonuclease n=1 Tax=Fusarium vanettenii (strain ATCC MYA-4622 / CBS 123669 / FGSC 9596 / NRRL 45880 / 77-13-4) TaxID=660122 RepID=C7YPZ7_FUSV7|nr:bacterial-type extracellular deoxyribonuclease [Fusarium vanettenii 77-13-4]EEU45937.1 bacterial-type extracellular deoxyribonuclease [Fusarium vanettenii 77-13-4]